jgi:hypothetical protein
MGSYTHTTSGSWTYSSGSLNAQTSTLRFAFVSPAQTFTPGTADYYNFEWAGTGNGDLTISGTLVVANNLTLSATYVYSDLLSGTIEAKGDIDITSADYNGDQTTAVILINGTGDQTISSSGGGSFGPININKPSGTLIMLGTIGAANDWTHTAGTVDAGTSTLSLRSTSNSDTFTPGSMV